VRVKRDIEVSPKLIRRYSDMKYINTRTQAIEVKKDAKAWGEATVALAKSLSKMPVAIGKDISTEIRTSREARKAYEEFLKSREQSEG
jgi:hypothetical protein